MKAFLKNWGLFIAFVVVLLGLRLFVITPVSVQGHSMDPTLADGQKLITLKHFTPERFDIITTQEPDDLSKLAVKRVIGLPGDTVEMHDDVLSINGKVVKEAYLDDFKKQFATDKLHDEYQYNPNYQMLAAQSNVFTKDFATTVPEGKYFVLGDNRLISKDSRIFGFVDPEMIQGKVWVRYWPFDKITNID